MALSSVGYGADQERQGGEAAAGQPQASSSRWSRQQEASKKEQWADCVAKIKETEAVPNRTPYDLYVSNDILGFCALRAGDSPSAIQAWSQVLDSEFADPAAFGQLAQGFAAAVL
jgi:hypothetical protein